MTPPFMTPVPMSPPFNVLFICTANACRSQMAEAILRAKGGDRFVVRSAGVSPAGFVHPLVPYVLNTLGIPIEEQYSKSFETLLDVDHDIILTLCDAVAMLTPPAWQGEPILAHWSVPDPVVFPGTDEEKRSVAVDVGRKLDSWIEALVALPLDEMDHAAIRTRLFAIAER